MGKWRGQSNKVCFTVNNYTDQILSELEENFDNWLENKNVVYAIVGEECGESGTLHLQGYARLSRHFKKARQW